MSFLLYDELVKYSKTLPVETEWTRITTALCNLSKEHAEIAMALIIHHNSGNSTIPYGGTPITAKLGYSTQWSNLPDDLKMILVAFLKQISL